MEESTKKKIYQIEIIAAIILLLVSVILLSQNSGITGYVSMDVKNQKINLTIGNSQSYILTTNSQDPFYLSSLKLSGEIIGEGIVKVYVATGNQKILVYSNVIKKEKGLKTITGVGRITGSVVAGSKTGDYLVIGYLENIEGKPESKAEDEVIVSGPFKNECVDSCFIEMLLSKEIAYQLLFYVEDGTILNINEVGYTTRKD